MDTATMISTATKVPLLEYFGFEVFLLKTDSSPLSVYALHGDSIAKAKLVFRDGIFKKAEIQDIQGSTPLGIAEKEKFQLLLEEYLSELVKGWIDYYVFAKSPKFEKILRNL
jgi:hypothetical protein